jgi:hypothetical protein
MCGKCLGSLRWADQDSNPGTCGLKDRSETESSPEVRCDRDRVVTFADGLLRQAAEGGAVAREDAEMLAREWLTISGADLAMGVLMGGKHEAAQLIELCGCVLRTMRVVCEPTNMAEDDANGRGP